MPRLGVFQKAPPDIKRYTIDYTPWLDGARITAKTFAIDNTTTPPLTVTNSSVDGTGAILSFYVGGGEAGETYVVDVTITTDDTQVKEDAIVFSVADP